MSSWEPATPDTTGDPFGIRFIPKTQTRKFAFKNPQISAMFLSRKCCRFGNGSWLKIIYITVRIHNRWDVKNIIQKIWILVKIFQNLMAKSVPVPFAHALILLPPKWIWTIVQIKFHYLNHFRFSLLLKTYTLSFYEHQ